MKKNAQRSGLNLKKRPPKILLAMKMSALFLFSIMFASAASNSFSQEEKVTLHLKDAKLSKVFDEIEAQTHYSLFYKKDVLDDQKIVSVSVNDGDINEVLATVLAGQNVTYKVIDQSIVIVPKYLDADLSQQEKITVHGTVTDEDGNAIPGVSVVVAGTMNGTITNNKGGYVLTNVPQGAVLQFSFVGMKEVKVEVNGRTEINVTLEEATIGLEEVVAIGYGVMRKSDLTGATNRLTEDKMNKSVAISPIEMIQGRVPGVNIMQNNGEPGSGMSVRVRGTNSIRSGQDPLYVVDGVPLDNADITPDGATPAGINQSSNKNPISFLNPEDIESIDILKDASATAIYGARGANGVILITTKNGTKGKGTITYDGYYGVSQIREKIDVLSADQFRQYTKEDGSKLLDLGASTDWQDEIFRTATAQSHNLSYGGGTDNLMYRASVGYLDQEGIIGTTGLEKINGNIKVNQTSFNGRLNLQGTLIASHIKDNRAPIGETGGFEGDLILTALKLNPTFPIYEEDGSYYQHSIDQRNPVAMMNLTDDVTQTDRVLANISTELELISNLKYKLNFGLDRTVAERKVNQGYELNYLTNKGEANVNSITANNKIIENFITYNTRINQHSIHALAGHAYQYFKVSGTSLRVFGFEVDDILYTNNLGYGNSSSAEAGSYAYERELQSFFGRINYSFDHKYLMTLTARTDGSSKFGENKKYGFFPSVALAWRISEEPFLENVEVISNLKFRLGWGATGNQEIPDKISLLSVGTTSSANGFFNGELTPGITFLRTPNPDIQWETTYQTNFGLDFGLWNNRLIGTVDVFHKRTKDVLLEIPAKAPAATQTQWQNVPDMEIVNKGFEIGLDGILVNSSDFSWNLGLNFSKVNNEVKDLPVKLIETGNASGQGLSGTRVQIITNGEPIGTFYGRVFQGFDENGISQYKKDEEGNDVLEPLGSALPDFTYSFNTSFTYKGFDLSMFWYGSEGNKVYNNTANAIFVKGTLDRGSNVTKSVYESNESPANSNAFSSRFVEDGSFLRFSNLTIGYTFNTKGIDWLNKARIYVTGNNLALFTDYTGFDPEVSVDASENGVPSMGIDYTSYPKPRTFTLGINLRF
ncbi:TonB-dependent receptor [Thermophagus xiamenensis]|uniref:Iron complex outermembrane recepter protein n=1 Tax=Thermophagus xiamenensis TaxID=385682 RepID=A0A1I2DUC4_9BACT|nr:TonB-dependent receptor [Thermophagus xiamenensis]SFE83520.1 iron complex outermembrane recepter protein [Thermophagus xiamenensis]